MPLRESPATPYMRRTPACASVSTSRSATVFRAMSLARRGGRSRRRRVALVPGDAVLARRAALLRDPELGQGSLADVPRLRPFQPDVLQHVPVAVAAEHDFVLRRCPARRRVLGLEEHGGV